MKRRAAKAPFPVLAILIAAAIAAKASAGIGLVIVKNAKSPLPDALTAKQVKDIYLGKTQSMDDMRLTPLNLQDPEAFAAFTAQFLRMSVAAYKSYWIKKLLSDGGSAPKIVESADDMLRSVSETSGALGYLRAEDFKKKADKARELGVVEVQTASK